MNAYCLLVNIPPHGSHCLGWFQVLFSAKIIFLDYFRVFFILLNVITILLLSLFFIVSDWNIALNWILEKRNLLWKHGHYSDILIVLIQLELYVINYIILLPSISHLRRNLKNWFIVLRITYLHHKINFCKWCQTTNNFQNLEVYKYLRAKFKPLNASL